MKDRLKEMDLKLTEFSKYLKVSRPTLYKFIQLYEEGNVDLLPKGVVDIFDFITKEIVPSKVDVINFIFNDIQNELSAEEDKMIKELLSSDNKEHIFKLLSILLDMNTTELHDIEKKIGGVVND